MNILDAIKKVSDEPLTKVTNGYNTIEFGEDTYEIKISDAEGNVVTVLMSNYKVIGEDVNE